MTETRYGRWLLNGLTITVTILALVVGIERIREILVGGVAVQASGPKRRVVANWQAFARNGTRMGPANARVTIVEFSDFQCPYCRVASGDLHDLRRWYGKDVAVVYRHLPIHRFARPAAIAAECAGEVGHFESFHDLLFAEPESIGVKPWTRFALEAGIRDTTKFVACTEQDSIAARVTRDSAAAVVLGAAGTPTLLVNNLLFVGNPGFEQLNDVVKATLKPPHS